MAEHDRIKPHTPLILICNYLVSVIHIKQDTKLSMIEDGHFFPRNQTCPDLLEKSHIRLLCLYIWVECNLLTRKDKRKDGTFLKVNYTNTALSPRCKTTNISRENK